MASNDRLMNKQAGVTLGGMMFFLMLLTFAAYIAARVVPAYMDYWMVRSTLEQIASQADVGDRSNEQIRDQLMKQLRLNNVTVVDRSDLSIERIPGGVYLSVPMASKKPFMGPLHLCMEFQAEARSTGGR